MEGGEEVPGLFEVVRADLPELTPGGPGPGTGADQSHGP